MPNRTETNLAPGQRLKRHSSLTLALVLLQTILVITALFALLPYMGNDVSSGLKILAVVTVIGALILHIVLIGVYEGRRKKLIESCSLTELLDFYLQNPGERRVRENLYNSKWWSDSLGSLSGPALNNAMQAIEKLNSRINLDLPYLERNKVRRRTQLYFNFLETVEAELDRKGFDENDIRQRLQENRVTCQRLLSGQPLAIDPRQ